MAKPAISKRVSSSPAVFIAFVLTAEPVGTASSPPLTTCVAGFCKTEPPVITDPFVPPVRTGTEPLSTLLPFNVACALSLVTRMLPSKA